MLAAEHIVSFEPLDISKMTLLYECLVPVVASFLYKPEIFLSDQIHFRWERNYSENLIVFQIQNGRRFLSL